MNKCLRPQCGHEWISRVEKPECCPRCKSYDWDKAKGAVETQIIPAPAITTEAKPEKIEISVPVILPEKTKASTAKPAAPEVQKQECVKCKGLFVPGLVENGICIFCNERIVTVKCPGCTRTVGKNVINKSTGYCIHCEGQ